MKIMETLTGFHSEFPLREGIQREDLRIQVSLDIGPFNHVVSELSKSNLLVENGSVITSVNHEVVLDDKSKLESADFINKLSVSPFSPPTDSVLHEDVVNYLTNRGEVVNVGQGIVFLASAFDEMLLYVKFTIEDKGEVTVGDVRTRFDTSRKYVLAFMEYLDQQQITRRLGDSRILR
ncbi:MAG: hypothetical protein CL887_01750 [Dehalococcoidia bacterium]|nr:hypothetical protein [Dehalococcoidia bacterium]